MGRPIRPPQPPATTRRSDHCYPEDAVNTTYSFPSYVTVGETVEPQPAESPRDRLIRESTVALCTDFDANKMPRSSFDVALELIRDHADTLYPPE